MESARIWDPGISPTIPSALLRGCSAIFLLSLSLFLSLKNI